MIRITKGVGSNPKAWAVLYRDGAPRSAWKMAGEFDLSDDAGWVGYIDDSGRKVPDPTGGINGMSGIIWANDGTEYNVQERLLYDSIEDWAADIQDEYPEEEIVWALTKKWDAPFARKAKK